MAVALVEPRAFLVVLYLIVQFHHFALQRDHVVVQLGIVGVGVAPVHIGLAVFVGVHRRVDVVPVALVPNERFAERVLERSVG